MTPPTRIKAISSPLFLIISCKSSILNKFSLVLGDHSIKSFSESKPCNFNWKNNTDKEWGFIAHELQSVVPECVKGKKDEKKADGTPKYQQVDTNKLIPLLVGAIKDLSLEVSKLQTRVATLESK